MYISEQMIENSVNTVYVFGDNLMHDGYGGQAKVARKFVKNGKSIGIPTKRKPEDSEDAYFSDREDEKRAVRYAFKEIRELKRKGLNIIFFPGIGEGLADLPHRSPEIYGLIKGFIKSFELN